MRPWRPSSKALRALGLVVGLAAAVDLFLNGYVRFLGLDDPTNVYDETLGWRQPLIVDGVMQQFGPSAPPPAGASLLLLGNATTRAANIQDHHLTFGGRLHAVNAAMESYGMQQEVALFRGYFAPTQPRQVGLIVSVGDFIPFQLQTAFGRAWIADRYPRMAPSRSALSRIIAWQNQHVAFDSEATLPLRAELEQRRWDLISGSGTIDAAVMSEWTGALGELAAAAGGRLFVAIVPPERHIAKLVHGHGGTPLYDQVRAACAGLGIAFVDLRPALTSITYPNFYDTQLALSELGHQAIATALTDFLAHELVWNASSQLPAH